MDCKTAHHLLAFARPPSIELEAEDARLLEGHLLGCPDCEALARVERQADEQFARAMQAVPVPIDLRRRLLARLDTERKYWYRRCVALPAGLVAAVLLVAIGSFSVWMTRKATVDISLAQIQADQRTPEQVDAWLKTKLPGASLPPRLNFALLKDYGMADFQGHLVPKLLFDTQAQAPQVGLIQAKVYVLSGKIFDLKNLPEHDPSGSGIHRVEIWLDDPDDPRIAYFILYEGDSLVPFLSTQLPQSA